MRNSLINLSKHGLFLAGIIGSQIIFAARNPDSVSACKEFKVAASNPPAAEVVFNYGSRLVTFYKDDENVYYTSLENKVPFYPTGDISVQLLPEVSLDEYKSFAEMCGLVVREDKENLNLDDGNDRAGGFYYLQSPGLDPVSAALALQASEWFETVIPDFRTTPKKY